MKKYVLASVIALAGLSLIGSQALCAQDSDTISIKDQAEFNAYQNATTQSDPAAKASAIEAFLSTYPQSVVKKPLLITLLETYQQIGDANKSLDAAGRVLQVDPGNLEAISVSVFIKKSQKQFDDAASFAAKGLALKKPEKVKDADWKDQTTQVYPLFHAALAYQALNVKKDYKSAISEFNLELQLTPSDQTGNVLLDILALADAYTNIANKDGSRDVVKGIWFYARAWNFVPANYKAQINKPLEYWYKKFHGNLEGLNDIRTQSAATMFPPGTLSVKAADTPADIAHKTVLEGGLDKLALADKEFILTYGAKADADAVWAVMKDQVSPIPGIVIEATASTIKVAVTDDAKQAKSADFVVNLKTPLAEKDIPLAGAEYKIPTEKAPAAELVGTLDSYTQIPATDANPQPSVNIVVKDGQIIPAKKTAPAHPAGPAHKPGAAHHGR